MFSRLQAVQSDLAVQHSSTQAQIQDLRGNSHPSFPTVITNTPVCTTEESVRYMQGAVGVGVLALCAVLCVLWR